MMNKKKMRGAVNFSIIVILSLLLETCLVERMQKINIILKQFWINKCGCRFIIL